MGAHDAIVTVAGVGIQGHVGHDHHVRVFRLEAADGTGDQATFVEALGAVLTFEAVGHLGEQHHTADPQIPGTAHLVPQGVKTPALAARHGGNGFVPSSLMDEEGIDQILGLQKGLTHHGPQGRRAPQTAGSVQQVQHVEATALAILRNPLQSPGFCPRTRYKGSGSTACRAMASRGEPVRQSAHCRNRANSWGDGDWGTWMTTVNRRSFRPPEDGHPCCRSRRL